MLLIRPFVLPCLRFVVYGATLIYPVSAVAQQSAEQDSIRRWTGSLDVGLTLTSGNSNTSSVSVGLDVKYELASHRFTLKSTLVHQTDDPKTDTADVSVNKGRTTLQYDLKPGEKLFYLAKIAFSYDIPAGLSRQWAPGLGAGYALIKSSRVEFTPTLGASWISRTFIDDSTSTGVYANLGESFTLKIRNSELTQSYTYSPLLNDLSNNIMHFDAALSSKFASWVGLKLTLIYNYNSRPFTDDEGNVREKGDLTFLTTLNLTIP